MTERKVRGWNQKYKGLKNKRKSKQKHKYTHIKKLSNKQTKYFLQLETGFPFFMLNSFAFRFCVANYKEGQPNSSQQDWL